jgi:hypothetical protein
MGADAHAQGRFHQLETRTSINWEQKADLLSRSSQLQSRSRRPRGAYYLNFTSSAEALMWRPAKCRVGQVHPRASGSVKKIALKEDEESREFTRPLRAPHCGGLAARALNATGESEGAIYRGRAGTLSIRAVCS